MRRHLHRVQGFNTPLIVWRLSLTMNWTPICGLRWQSAAATPLWRTITDFESGVALGFAPQSIWFKVTTSDLTVSPDRCLIFGGPPTPCNTHAPLRQNHCGNGTAGIAGRPVRKACPKPEHWPEGECRRCTPEESADPPSGNRPDSCSCERNAGRPPAVDNSGSRPTHVPPALKPLTINQPSETASARRSSRYRSGPRRW